MPDQESQEWEKELKVLLELIRTQPSKDLIRERERVVVLNQLIAERSKRLKA